MQGSDPVPWWRTLDRSQWFVFAMASAAWLFDCLDQQLFMLARPAAMKALLPPETDTSQLKAYGTIATALFVAGWAMGGLIFGALGDRIGRAKTLAITVLIYSLCTGLSAFSKGFVDFSVYRFLTGLGVGGVFGLAVALVADSVPDAARPHALGWLQALSAVGNITAGAIAIALGGLELSTIQPGSAWSKLFLIGALPAFLCVFVLLRVKEPRKWVEARARARGEGVKFGSYRALLGEARWRKNAVVGLTLCIAAIVGLWGIGFFSPELIGDVIGRALQREGVPIAQQAGYRTIWTGITMILQNTGSFFGILFFARMASRYGRKPAFAVAFILAMLTTTGTFKFLSQRSDIFWMIPLMGFCQLAPFGGFAIYLPELFPLSLRSTGTSFCYNVGRFIAAGGPFLMGRLTVTLAANAQSPEAKLDAFRNACGWMSVIFLLGLLALPFAPETKGQPLPEESPA